MVSPLGCRGDASSSERDGPDPSGSPPHRDAASEPAWGAGASPPASIELSAELSAQTYDSSVEPVAIPDWTVAVVVPGTDPRPLVYQQAKLARRIHFAIRGARSGETQIAIMLHWWSMADLASFGFAGIDCEFGVPEGPLASLAEMMAAAAPKASVECAAMRGQARADATRIRALAQTKGWAMMPALPELIELFAVPLPSEPVGIGGSWTATHAGEGMNTTRRYTLVGVEADQLTLDFAATTTFGARPSEDATGTFRVSVFDPLARSGSIDVITRTPGADPSAPPDEYTLRVELVTQ